MRTPPAGATPSPPRLTPSLRPPARPRRLLTFYAPAVADCVSNGLLGALIDVAKTATKEKVVRAAVLALRNILERDTPARATAEAAAGRIASALRLRAFQDEEIAAALALFEERSAVSAKEASSFEAYKQEVLSGSLEWSPARSSEAFWREHAGRFEEGNCQLVRVLVKLLESPDPKTLAVACSDLGQFAAAHPRGRAIVAECGGKEKVMSLMSSSDQEVQKAALISVQKLLVTNWQFLTAAGGVPAA